MAFGNSSFKHERDQKERGLKTLATWFTWARTSHEGSTEEEKADLSYIFANYAAIVMWELSSERPTNESLI